MTDPGYTSDRYSSYRHWVVYLAHLKKDHGYFWTTLKKMFPGEGRQVWEDARYYYQAWVEVDGDE